MIPFRVFCTKRGETSIWDEQPYPFEPLDKTAT
jgi:hypothetical protein